MLKDGIAETTPTETYLRDTSTLNTYTVDNSTIDTIHRTVQQTPTQLMFTQSPPHIILLHIYTALLHRTAAIQV